MRHITTTDILDGTSNLPFTSRAAWLSTKSECPDLRRTAAHLRQGTRPSKKLTNVRDVKRYLNIASISKDGLLVVKRNIPFAPSIECIIIPRQVLDGLLTSLHIKLDHPSGHQLKSVLDLDKAIESVTNTCHQRASLQKMQKLCEKQSSSDPPETVGSSFAADVMRRERQIILVLRKCVTSYTFIKLLESERTQELRDAIIQLLAEVHSLDGPSTIIRTDQAPGFKALVNDELLTKHRIAIELGRAKNVNKNPVAERAIQELEVEILRFDTDNKVVSHVSLALITARLNTCIGNRGLSAREMWSERDQFLNTQIPIIDQDLILAQHELRQRNHSYSERAKYPCKTIPPEPQLCVGDIVYIRCDLNKTKSRDRYLGVSIDYPWCNIRRFAGQQFRESSYRVKISDCFKVLVISNPAMLADKSDESSDEESEKVSTCTSLLALPGIPKEISSIPKPNISVEPSSAVDINNPPEPPDIRFNPLPETNSDNEDIVAPPNAPTRPQR